jgi:hypothetical protein
MAGNGVRVAAALRKVGTALAHSTAYSGDVGLEAQPSHLC